MKQLILLRHGKAAADSPTGDHGRELTERGQKDVAFVIERAVKKGLAVERIVSSTAARALMTAEIALKRSHCKAPIVEVGALYNAALRDILETVEDLPDTIQTALLVGHNPGFEEFAGSFTESRSTWEGLPTAGLAWLELPIARWKDVRIGVGIIRAVITPKS